MYRLAKDINVSPIRISQIVHGKRSISADTAIRLGKYFGTSMEIWVGLQTDYDIERMKDVKEDIEKEVVSYKDSQKIIKSSIEAKKNMRDNKVIAKHSL